MEQARLSTSIAVASALGLTLLLSGCGKTAFTVTSASEVAQAPGTFTIPPKVDILLAEDDTGSRLEAYDAINQQFNGFLSRLASTGWDYHFTSIPLTTDQPTTEITASNHDGNWGAQWVPGYPGASQFDADTVSPSLFVFPQNYTFLSQSQVGSSGNGAEPGFDTIYRALYNRLPGTGFLRPDALLVIITVSNGNDTSGINYCTRSDGVVIPCNDGSATTSFNNYLSAYKALKSTPGAVQFHAAVATSSGYDYSCLNGVASQGSRYMQMATALNGGSYNICSVPVSTILSSLAGYLQPIQQSLETRYLPMSSQPDPTSITVTKYIGGNANQAVTIPQNATNGWTYAGSVSNVYLIDAPIPMNLYSGYAIELHGSAKLQGADRANVNYTHAGSQNSAQ